MGGDGGEVPGSGLAWGRAMGLTFASDIADTRWSSASNKTGTSNHFLISKHKKVDIPKDQAIR